MNSQEAFGRSRVRLSSLGTASAAGYVIAAVAQRVIRAVFLESDGSPVQEMLVRSRFPDQVRAP
jgi:hypothetical protein